MATHPNLAERELTRIFRALADNTRQEILFLLEECESTVPLDEIVAAIPAAGPSIPRHLSVLRNARLVVEHWVDQHSSYSLNGGALTQSMLQFFGQFRAIREAPSLGEDITDLAPLNGEVGDERRAILVSAVDQLRAALGTDIELIYRISAEQLELLVCDRLDAMGFEVKRVGHTYAADGGVDIVSWPRETHFPYLIAVQVKHRRRPAGRIGSGPVKDLLGVLQTSPFDAGVLVTNTSFTPSAKWFARNGSRVVRLRDLEDLRQWIAGNFLTSDLRDFPREIELAPGVRIKVR